MVAPKVSYAQFATGRRLVLLAAGLAALARAMP